MVLGGFRSFHVLVTTVGKKESIPMQNTHDLLVGTLSIGIPSLFLCNQSLGVLPGASNRNCGYFARTSP